MDPSLLDAFGLVGALGSVATVVMVVRGWRSFWDRTLTERDRQIAEAAAYFLVVPVVVLAHEGGHALATLGAGGRVVDFHYRFFWGSVTSAGAFSPAEGWWIALAGNLVSAGAGVGLLATGWAGRRLPPALRLTLIDGGRLQVLFTLVAYPVLSFVGLFGDWVAIYDFAGTPALSAITGAAHAGVLALWATRLRDRVAEARFALAHDAAGALAEHRRAVAADPADPGAHLALAALLATGDVALARRALARATRDTGGDPRVLLEAGRYALAAAAPAEAAMTLRRALEGGGADPATEQLLWANLGVALTRMERPDEALAAFARVEPPLADAPAVAHWRDQARELRGRRSG